MFAMQNESVPRHPALLFAAATLLGLYCSLLFGADTPTSADACPGRLPRDVDIVARPIRPGGMPVTELPRVIEAHVAGRLQEAAAIWRQLDMPHEDAVWKHLGIGAAHLYVGDFDTAATELRVARQVDPENAVVHYFTGLLRREQARTVGDEPGTALASEVRLPRHAAEQGFRPGRTKSRFLSAAISEFELAISYAHEIDLDQRLAAGLAADCNDFAVGTAVTMPTIRELVDSLGADNFVGKAHGLLAHLYLDCGRPEEAEAHVDQAEVHGIPVPHGYRLVGRMFEAQGRRRDAFRAYEKATRGDGFAKPGSTVVDDMNRAFEELF